MRVPDPLGNTTDDEIPEQPTRWHDDWNQSEPHPLLTSATDLLLAWMPEQTGTIEQSWDKYFGAAEANTAQSGLIRTRMPIPDNWDANSANAAVDCLFEFVHALERLDIDAAMACVAEDYHAFEAGCEVDRGSLRLRLEGAFDRWRSGKVSITLAEVPDPIFHQEGILIHTLVQIDQVSTSDVKQTTELLSRIVVFRETARGGWRIGALSPVD